MNRCKLTCFKFLKYLKTWESLKVNLRFANFISPMWWQPTNHDRTLNRKYERFLWTLTHAMRHVPCAERSTFELSHLLHLLVCTAHRWSIVLRILLFLLVLCQCTIFIFPTLDNGATACSVGQLALSALSKIIAPLRISLCFTFSTGFLNLQTLTNGIIMSVYGSAYV